MQLVVTSPLTRALQTATAVLSTSSSSGSSSRESSTTPPAASGQQQQGQQGQGSSPSSTGPSEVPAAVVAVEAVREAYGAYLPDKRRTKAELAAAFSPPVDFGGISEGEDPLWTPGSRETLQAVRARARGFLGELLPRPERQVLVVSHGVFLQCLLQVGERVRQWRVQTHTYARFFLLPLRLD